ncbi:MAG TPA: hypothetical protein VEK57_08815 [Thermoanaerobaculia bacterium]|nr:hypothetical protein [Thermoanaerobaculia bacterium]
MLTFFIYMVLMFAGIGIGALINLVGKQRVNKGIAGAVVMLPMLLLQIAFYSSTDLSTSDFVNFTVIPASAAYAITSWWIICEKKSRKQTAA